MQLNDNRAAKTAVRWAWLSGSNCQRDMKRLIFVSIGLLSGLALNNVLAGDLPRGTLLELHSCELYAGGCVVSSEATLGGRYMLRAWDFSSGSFADNDLSGLQLAVLQSASQNLAADNTSSEQTVVYLPQEATAGQRAALLAWLKSSQPEFQKTSCQTRVVPLHFAKSGTGYRFSAGDFVAVATAPLESCQTGACGEALWYKPRTETSVFTVAVDRSSQVTEPLVKLKWHDAGKRSIFLAKFGPTLSGKNVFVTSADFCGPAEKLF